MGLFSVVNVLASHESSSRDFETIPGPATQSEDVRVRNNAKPCRAGELVFTCSSAMRLERVCTSAEACLPRTDFPAGPPSGSAGGTLESGRLLYAA